MEKYVWDQYHGGWFYNRKPLVILLCTVFNVYKFTSIKCLLKTQKPLLNKIHSEEYKTENIL